MDLYEQSHKEEEEFAKLIPKSGFFADYLDYTRYQESPGSFHFWVAATIIAAVLQRRVWINKGAYLVYPNLFTILVAPTGKCRKSTAMDMGTNLLAGTSLVNVVASKTTPEGLLESLAFGSQYVGDGIQKPEELNRDSCGLIKASELAVFLNKASYNQDMVTILTSLYDCLAEFTYSTRTKKQLALRNIAVSFLGASTADWLASALPKDAFGGGFMSRFVFIVKEESDRRITMIDYHREEQAKELKKKLKEIQRAARGVTKLTKEAHDWYVKWYYESKGEPIDDLNLTGFVERKQDLILKVAMILAASHYYHTIDLSTMLQAYEIVTWTQKKAFEAFRYVGLTSLGALKEKILDYVKLSGGRVKRSEITRRFSRQLPNGMGDIDAIEKLFAETGEIQIESITANGRAGKLYVWKGDTVT